MIKNFSPTKLTGTSLGNYHIQTFVGQSKIGPAYLARTDATNTYLIRFLDWPIYSASNDNEAYLQRFQYSAAQIATLQHPYILPLLDYGIFRSLPYLVSPHIPLRSLRTRIDKNGALNTFTIGRYLDQIATALEYAHEHSVLHGSLSVDSIFIRLDGQLVVADTGVQSLLEKNSPDIGHQLPQWNDGFAPEQLQGKPASPASDVYALGVIIYYLLTGTPVFEGNTPDEIAQQHLYAPIPPLSLWRTDLPPGLYGVLARTLAKDPAQRYHQPGAFANAFHSVIGPTNRTRLPFVVTQTPGGQGYQPPAGGSSIADMQYTERSWSNNKASPADFATAAARSASYSSNPHSIHGFFDEKPLNMSDTPRPALMRRLGRKQGRRTTLIAALVALLLIASAALAVTLLVQKSGAAIKGGGQVTFFANQSDPGGQTNSLNISIQNLQAPPSGFQYDAWIINDQTEQVLDLGKLNGKGQNWSLTYSASSGNLLEDGDKLEITQEQGTVTAPAGKVILTGMFPVMAFQHVQHLLVSYPDTPGHVGMLTGLLQQTHLLDNQAAVLQSVSAGQNSVAISCIAQSMIDIIEGSHGSHYKPLGAACIQQNVLTVGDGFGLLGKGFIDGAEEHASLALSQKDATINMHQHAALMDIALTNVSGWVTTIEQDALQLRAHPNTLTSVQQITTLADDAYHGVDANGNGQIDPVAGEAGALTAYQQGQLMATLTLTPGI